MTFELIIFDYDGVLIDSLSDAICVGEEFCRGVSHDRVPTKEIVESLENVTYPEIGRSTGLPSDQIDKFCSHIFDRFQEIGPSMAFFPGIESLLHRITAQKIAIVSGNAKHVIAAKLAAHGLSKKIKCIYGGLDSGDKTEKILKVCNHFKVDPRSSCMIGDSASDIRYAKRASVQSIAVTWGWQAREKLVREKPDIIVNSVQELSILLDSPNSFS